MKSSLCVLLLLALAPMTGCSTSSSSLRGLAQEQHDDAVKPPRNGEDVKAFAERCQERGDKVIKLIEAQKIVSASDHFHAAMVLVECKRESDLALAHQEALRAAELGEKRGPRVAAEALDKLLLKRGMMQRYGTQFVWEPVLREWRLYPIDPRTTDEERKTMGVPPLAEIRQQETDLNKRQKSKTASK